MGTATEALKPISVIPAFPRTGFIHSPLYDSFIFLFSPTICLLLMMCVYKTPLVSGKIDALGLMTVAPALTLIFIITKGHVASVFVRSHLNRQIFQKHRAKLLVAPVALLIAMNLSIRLFIALWILHAFWNFYHFARQHFGIARLYDAKIRKFSAVERQFDLAVCLGVFFLPTFIASKRFLGLLDPDSPRLKTAGLGFLSTVYSHLNDAIDLSRPMMPWLLAAIVTLYFLYNLWIFFKGHSVSWQKMVFISQLVILYVVGWMVLDPWLGFFASMLLHSWQYYGLLSVTERKSINQRFGTTEEQTPWITCILVIGIGVLFGIYCQRISPSVLDHPAASWAIFLYSIVIMVNLVHFWFDGFIWEARKTV